MTRIGTAGWQVPPQHADLFETAGSHLQRYARRFDAVEINSSFYRPHQPKTYARWAASVPEDFRFAVKIPKEITHGRRLVDADEALALFLGQVEALGERLGPLLVQLPPSLRFEPAVAERFLEALRRRFDGNVAVEPRHPSWFTDAADGLLVGGRAARVAASPACVPRAALPGGWPGLTYYRLHGTPQIYYSPYSEADLDALAAALRARPSADAPGWCIFDNTARGAAANDAMRLRRKLD
jgi:uncharacterized protein YecE (DUF72 family)